LDPNTPEYNPGLAAKIWPYYEEVFKLEDSWLGEIMSAAGPNAAIFLVSDHGMAAQYKRFYPNAVLERAGLLARGYDEIGRQGEGIDLSRTRACVPPHADFFVVVNSVDWKGGIVQPSEREAVLKSATDALLAATDPATGQRIVTAAIRAEDVAGLGTGGETGGDLYLEVAPGYYPVGQLSTYTVEPLLSPIGAGAHGFLPLRRSMQAICVIGGAGIIPGSKLGGVRQIDVAPTAARLLGIPIPRDARGHVLGEILTQD
jgi:predicted AlkP superfamily phosphohydrolase/phosphomutase